MSIPQIVEVAIGLIFIYYVLGALVSLITQLVMESVQTRGVALEKYLKIMAGDMAVDLTNLPQIKALRPVRFARWWNIFGAGIVEKKLERVPVETLVDGFFDLTGLTATGSLNAGELTTLIGKLPDSEGKQALLGWISHGVTAINDLRERTSAYFGGMLHQAALTFRARARSVVIVASVLATLLFGIDSIQLAKKLWENAGLRALASQQAAATTSQLEGLTSAGALLTDLGAFSFRLGWWRTGPPMVFNSFGEWFNYVGSKLAGLGITALAVSQGSSFWYDLLKKITGSTASQPDAGSDPPGPQG